MGSARSETGPTKRARGWAIFEQARDGLIAKIFRALPQLWKSSEKCPSQKEGRKFDPSQFPGLGLHVNWRHAFTL